MDAATERLADVTSEQQPTTLIETLERPDLALTVRFAYGLTEHDLEETYQNKAAFRAAARSMLERNSKFNLPKVNIKGKSPSSRVRFLENEPRQPPPKRQKVDQGPSPEVLELRRANEKMTDQMATLVTALRLLYTCVETPNCIEALSGKMLLSGNGRMDNTHRTDWRTERQEQEARLKEQWKDFSVNSGAWKERLGARSSYAERQRAEKKLVPRRIRKIAYFKSTMIKPSARRRLV
ncbi:hypothetical protein K402DRAFT_421553 [Aulographum hederae CBS 113979]|uniref:Uncharacterized protein n=1 Tax=Aulographum hederae CBS 113979 TaxID=1176131 RepID=A0A6G1GYZ0_9PEZI|nr:hypothetical protein K402DRAFT_421553 [Aulographum hederae CBS 113979]